ncbi:hypothetical protein M9434_002364 [Picochlorum sp. BPE23]|nr:hypothetical protein M9434_002364 [Picochlorum sp. BPE23]
MRRRGVGQSSRSYFSIIRRLLSSLTESERIGFCFDIDGVLTKGSRALPEAQRALEILHNSNGKPRMPVAYLTNGGGVTEGDRSKQLASMFGIQIDPEQMILSHSPFRKLSSNFQSKPVLVVGRGDSQHVARHYGYSHIISSKQLIERNPSCVPFMNAESMHADSEGVPLYGTEQNPIEAIMIFTDPSDWYLEIQVILDLLLYGGVFGGTTENLNSRRQQPQLLISHGDSVWSNEFPIPRLGLGSFTSCLETLYKDKTGMNLAYRVFGKPHREAYLLAEDALQAQASKLWNAPTCSKIFAIGDNPSADIRGANRQGDPWVSVLVRTGVFKGGLNCSVDPAHIVVDNVEDAILTAMNHCRRDRWHSLR